MSKNKFLHHAPCSNCGSRDNLGVYEDHTYCFGCQQYQGNNEDIPEILDFIKKAGFTERSLESWNGEKMEAVIALDKGSIVGAIPFAVR